MRLFGRRAGLAIAGVLAIGLAASACTDLVLEPQSSVTEENAFDDTGAYQALLAKVYAGLSVSGQQGPAGDPDIEGIDEGFSQYIRGWWQLQSLPTDEAVIGWGDAGLPELVTGQWASTNQFVNATYYRVFVQIAFANEFLRETTQEALEARGHEGLPEIPQFRAEARLLRALSYWHGLDLFGSIPLITEDFEFGDPLPEQATKAEIFDFIESELTAIRSDLPAIGGAEYGRMDQGALSMLLGKLYMNAAAYGQGDRYADAVGEVEAVITSGQYQLDDNYHDMFLADNHTSPEFIFAVPFDGQQTQTWGGTTFLAHAAVGGNMDQSAYGLDFGWWGLRMLPEVVNLYEGGATGPDSRSAILFTDDQSLEVGNISDFFAGYAYPKYQNVTSTGQDGSNLTHVDTDFPMFRLADAYLMYAEAHLRSGAGDDGTALGYVNALRQRAYGDNSGDITLAEMTLDFILDERARELAWEGHRRTDLIRYGHFTGDTYVWSWKGNTQAGASIPAYRVVFPIPAQELIANPNLTQNEGY